MSRGVAGILLLPTWEKLDEMTYPEFRIYCKMISINLGSAIEEIKYMSFNEDEQNDRTTTFHHYTMV